ncbi:unnamed protein product [Arabis nemorensis]|uniref:Uncharacterized protein n=1 Tax=Arabis nemorensis TaxID=586526 RepID=A0A565C596_9BRAS|nr:unnamed protein product [Arabis nemorensis]
MSSRMALLSPRTAPLSPRTHSPIFTAQSPHLASFWYKRSDTIDHIILEEVDESAEDPSYLTRGAAVEVLVKLTKEIDLLAVQLSPLKKFLVRMVKRWKKI